MTEGDNTPILIKNEPVNHFNRIDIPSKIDKYTDLQRIKDKNAAVAHANGREVFIKFVPVDVRAGTRAEAEQVAKLRHPNIAMAIDNINYTDPQSGQEYHAFVSEHIKGRDLSDIVEELRHNPYAMDIDTQLKIIEQIAAAVDYANKKGVLHRDLKPGNIRIDDQGNAYLVDFGSANTVFQAQDGNVIGTPGYLSPEHARDQQKVSDGEEWDVANIAYELLTGIQPVEEWEPLIAGEKDTQIKNRLKILAAGNIDGLPDIDNLRQIFPDQAEKMGAVFKRGLAQNPGERYQTATEFCAKLREAVIQ